MNPPSKCLTRIVRMSSAGTGVRPFITLVFMGSYKYFDSVLPRYQKYMNTDGRPNIQPITFFWRRTHIVSSVVFLEEFCHFFSLSRRRHALLLWKLSNLFNPNLTWEVLFEDLLAILLPTSHFSFQHFASRFKYLCSQRFELWFPSSCPESNFWSRLKEMA
jgi:hypothetical protein